MSPSTPTLERPVAPAMDPRIKARRIEVRRREGRLRLQRLADAGMVLLVVAGFAVALRSPLLDVDRIAVSGAERTGSQAVLDMLGIERGDQLIDLDLTQAGAAVTALPWVSEVKIHRRVDGTVDVAVRERDPVAVVRAGGSDLLVDVEGRLLGPRSDAVEDLGPLVRIEGTRGGLEPGAHLDSDLLGALTLAGRLRSSAPAAVSALRAGADGLRATLATGGEVIFGGAERLDAKVRSLLTMLEQVDLSCLDRLDLRLPGSPVLTREDSCS